MNFVFGVGLYMAPEDMLLRVGKVARYNNEIIIAIPQESLGLNLGVNDSDAPPDILSREADSDIPSPRTDTSGDDVDVPSALSPPVVPSDISSEKSAANAHSDEKTDLIVGRVMVGLAVLWLSH